MLISVQKVCLRWTRGDLPNLWEINDEINRNFWEILMRAEFGADFKKLWS